MKTSLACPKCGGRKLFHIPEVHQPPEDRGWEYPTRPRPVTAVVATVRTTTHGQYEIVEAGPCEAVVCGTCGFVEWYASHAALAMLDTIARQDKHVRVIEGRAEPYR